MATLEEKVDALIVSVEALDGKVNTLTNKVNEAAALVADNSALDKAADQILFDSLSEAEVVKLEDLLKRLARVQVQNITVDEENLLKTYLRVRALQGWNAAGMSGMVCGVSGMVCGVSGMVCWSG